MARFCLSEVLVQTDLPEMQSKRQMSLDLPGRREICRIVPYIFICKSNITKHTIGQNRGRVNNEGEIQAFRLIKVLLAKNLYFSKLFLMFLCLIVFYKHAVLNST